MEVTHTVFELKQVDLVDSYFELTGCAQDLELGAHTHTHTQHTQLKLKDEKYTFTFSHLADARIQSDLQ